MQFITLLALCQLCYTTLPAVKMCDKINIVCIIRDKKKTEVSWKWITGQVGNMVFEERFCCVMEMCTKGKSSRGLMQG